MNRVSTFMTKESDFKSISVKNLSNTNFREFHVEKKKHLYKHLPDIFKIIFFPKRNFVKFFKKMEKWIEIKLNIASCLLEFKNILICKKFFKTYGKNKIIFKIKNNFMENYCKYLFDFLFKKLFYIKIFKSLDCFYFVICRKNCVNRFKTRLIRKIKLYIYRR
jgi:hypothetical protein